LSLFISLIILVINATLVAGVYALSAYLQFQVGDNSVTTTALISLIPAVGLIIIDVITSALLEFCVELEKWDFISAKNIQLMWRMYIAKIFTVLTVYLLVIYFTFFDKSIKDLIGIDLLDFQMNLVCQSDTSKLVLVNNAPPGATLNPYSKYNNCKEDLAASVILINLIVDFISRKSIPFIVNFFRWAWYVKVKGGTEYKRHYKVIDTACDTLIFYAQMFSLIPIFPFIIILAPVIITADFKFEIYHLAKLRTSPLELSLQDKMAYFMVTIFSFTMLSVNLLFVLYFSYGAGNANYLNCYDNLEYTFGPQQCGPFKNDETLKSVMLGYIASNTL
jgi:hypothetical protein